MSVHEAYRKRTMAELADEAIAIIIKQPGLRCGQIGDELFGDHAVLIGSAPYARLAGRVMKRLERQNLAFYQIRRDGFGGWYPTELALRH